MQFVLQKLKYNVVIHDAYVHDAYIHDECIHDASMYDTYIFDPWSLVLVHVYMMDMILMMAS